MHVRRRGLVLVVRLRRADDGHRRPCARRTRLHTRNQSGAAFSPQVPRDGTIWRLREGRMRHVEIELPVTGRDAVQVYTALCAFERFPEHAADLRSLRVAHSGDGRLWSRWELLVR